MVMILQGEGIKNKPVDKWQTANLHIKSNLNKELVREESLIQQGDLTKEPLEI